MIRHFTYLALFSILIVACSESGMERLESAKAAEGKGNFQEAMNLYQKILDDDPKCDCAAEVTFRLAALHRSFKKDALKAATLYESIAEAFPKSEFAHQGLFLAGFIYNNDLGNLDRARQAYEGYLTMYPDSSWARDAKFELANLGKTPDEILQSLRDTLNETQPEPSALEGE